MLICVSVKKTSIEGTGSQVLRVAEQASETPPSAPVLSSISQINNRKTLERATASVGSRGGRQSQSRMATYSLGVNQVWVFVYLSV